LLASKSDAGQTLAWQEMSENDLMPGDVTVRVSHSTINYKDGLAITAIVRDRVPETRVVMYTFNTEICEVARALGAAGCVSKELPYDVLLGALRQAAPGLSLVTH